jgi:hypothetical protein
VARWGSIWFFGDDDYDGIADDTAEIHHMDFKVLIGWYF